MTSLDPQDPQDLSLDPQDHFEGPLSIFRHLKMERLLTAIDDQRRPDVLVRSNLYESPENWNDHPGPTIGIDITSMSGLSPPTVPVSRMMVSITQDELPAFESFVSQLTLTDDFTLRFPREMNDYRVVHEVIRLTRPSTAVSDHVNYSVVLPTAVSGDFRGLGIRTLIVDVHPFIAPGHITVDDVETLRSLRATVSGTSLRSLATAYPERIDLADETAEGVLFLESVEPDSRLKNLVSLTLTGLDHSLSLDEFSRLKVLRIAGLYGNVDLDAPTIEELIVDVGYQRFSLTLSERTRPRFVRVDVFRVPRGRGVGRLDLIFRGGLGRPYLVGDLHSGKVYRSSPRKRNLKFVSLMMRLD